LTKPTLYNWLKRAKGQRLSSPYRQFRNAVRQAKTEAAVRKVINVFTHGNEDW
jgi:hypothetical protein